MRILFVDRSTKLQTIHDLKRRGRGGMVASLFHVSDYLSERGHDVTVLSDIENTSVTKYGTKWLHEAWGEYDCLILNRGTGSGYPEIKARHRVLWTHDLPHSGFIPEPKIMGGFSCTVFMSKYAERVWRTFYKTIGRSVLIPNGVDKEIFYPRQKTDTLIYASAPNRGLDKLPLILDAIRTRIGRDIELRAFSNLAKLHPNEGDDRFDYKTIEESSVSLFDPVSQAALSNHMGQASAMILPTPSPEICSNCVLQSLASGTPVITTGNIGSVPEWVRHEKNGMLTKYGPPDYMVHTVEMVRNAVKVLESDKLHQKLIRGASRTNVLTWKEVGKKWERMISRLK